MPCSDHYDGRTSAEMTAEQQAKLDKLTRMLCSALKLFERYAPQWLHLLDPETSEWWVAHKQLDKAREAISMAEGRRRERFKR